MIGRVVIATFASLISRVQQIIDASYSNGRHVFVTGRSMMDNVKMALKQKYLEAPEDILLPLEKMRGLPPEQITIITTGAQGEPTSALARMANRDHRHIEIEEGDTVDYRHVRLAHLSRADGDRCCGEAWTPCLRHRALDGEQRADGA